MGIRIGVPVLKLSRGAKQTKRKGDARKVAQEAGNERYSKDQDLDRSRSRLNEYTCFKSGKALADYWEAEAAKQTDALGRPLKSTAITGFAVIFKPDMEGMESMDEAERKQFVRDGISVTAKILEESGLQVDMTALHMDEIVEHGHILGHDPEYKAAKKLDIRLYAKLNKELPRRLREMGYDVEDLAVYDSEKVAQMTPEEQATYREERIQQKRAKKHGQSSNAYKREKLEEAETELKAQREALAKQQAEAEARLKDLETERIRLADQKRIQDKRQEELDKKEQAQKTAQEALNAQKADLARDRQNFTAECGKWQEKANTALREAINRESQNARNQVQEQYKQEVSNLRALADAYEKAKQTYELSAIQAKGIADGRSANKPEQALNLMRKHITERLNVKARWIDPQSMREFKSITDFAYQQALDATPRVHYEEQQKRTAKAAQNVRIARNGVPGIEDILQKSYGKDDYGMSK